MRSRKEYATLREKLIAAGIEAGHVKAVLALAGLNLAAVKPE